MQKNLLITFGNNLRKYRVQKKLSQEALAHEVELNRTYIGKIERAERNISLKTLAKIAQVLEVEPFILLQSE